MTVPPLPSWATRPSRGSPAPGSVNDQQLEAFIGPRWPAYRRKFGPFFEDPHFVPTWNWAAALLPPMWFLYRKLYVPFVFFFLLPGVAFGLLWGGEPPTHLVAGVLPGRPPLPVLTDDAALLLAGVLLSNAILAGGTANFLLFRRAQAAIRVIVPRSPSADAALPLLQRVGGVSWRAVAIGLVAILLLQAAAQLGAR